MFKFTSIWSKLGVIFLLVVFMMSSVGCGGDSTLSSQEQAKQALDESYKFLTQGFHAEALKKVNQSIELYPTQEALLVKANIEYLKGNKDDAYNSLVEFAKLYPSDGEDDFIKAIFLSLEKRNPQEILDRLKTALNDNFVGMEEEFWWEFIENEPSFAYFRSQPEYADILNLKDSYSGVITGCKENETKFEAHWWGPQIYIKEGDMHILNDVHDLTVVLAGLAAMLAPIAAIVAAAILVREVEIRERDKGCGIILNWTWLNFNPSLGVAGLLAYWVTVQK